MGGKKPPPPPTSSKQAHPTRGDPKEHTLNNQQTQGFTLIELLVVIAIIGVLAALLLPSFANSTKRPRDVAAVNCGRAVVTFQNANKVENSAYVPAVANMGGDVKEACTDQGVQVTTTDTVVTSGAATATNTLNVSATTFAFKVFHPEGTGYYYYSSAGSLGAASRMNKLIRW